MVRQSPPISWRAVWGPNSQGKTSLAEAIEFLLTGQIVRRMLVASSQDEFADALRNAHLPPGMPVFVQATILAPDASSHIIRRTLKTDYSKKQDCETALAIDAKPAAETALLALGIVLSQPPPLMLKTAANLGGLPMEAFDQLRAAVAADRSQFWNDLSMMFYGYNRPGAKISEGVRESFWLQGMMAGFPASYFCIKAFSETDLTQDLKKFDVPTLVLHGDDDQIVPIGASAMLSSKLIKNATLKVYKGAPHGMCTTLKDQVNAELLAFIEMKSGKAVAAA